MNAAMDCKTCDEMLAAYQSAVGLYTTSVSEIETQYGEFFCVPHPKTKLLRQACRYRHKAWMASDALMAHWREDQDGPAAKTVLGNGCSLGSQEAEQLGQSRRHADDALIAHLRHDHGDRSAESASS